MIMDHISWRMNVIWPEFVKRVIFDHSHSHFGEVRCDIVEYTAIKYTFSIYTCESATYDSQSSGTYIISYIQLHAHEYSKTDTLFIFYTYR